MQGNGYSWEETEPYETNAYRPPGMPLILLTIYYFFGVSVPHAILLQVLIATGAVFMTYVVTARLFGPGVGVVAAIFQGLDPLSISYSNLLLTEVYSSGILICCAFFVMKYSETGNKWFLWAISLILGAGILIHPILLFLPIIILVLPLLCSKTRRWRPVLSAGLVTIIALTPAGFWVVRNIKVADYAGISCVTAVNLMKYKAAGVMADLNGTDLLSEAKKLRDELIEFFHRPHRVFMKESVRSR